jgi:polyphosphate kinase
MDRNLFNRVEACFPIEDTGLKKRIYQQGLVNYLKDNQQAWQLQGDGTWVRVQAEEGAELHNAQRILLNLIK